MEKLVTLLDLLRGSIIALGRAPLPSENTQAVFSTAVRATCIAVSAVVTSDMNRYYTGECRVATISQGCKVQSVECKVWSVEGKV